MKKHLALLVVLASLLVGLSGCAFLLLGGAAAGGTYVYVNGEAKQDFNASLDRSYNATLAACQELKMAVTKKEKKLDGASVTAKDGSTDVWISLTPKTEKVTGITVRYGLTGDEAASKRIHDAITRNL
jgi:hypothetical protein